MPLHSTAPADGADRPVAVAADPLEAEAARSADALSVGGGGAKVWTPSFGAAPTRTIEDREASADSANRTITGSGGGAPLPAGLRSTFERRFKHDFGNVRVHGGPRAAALTRSHEARALTHGTDIYFADGEYAIDTAGGVRLLAHELTHVVQQAKGGRIVQRQERGAVADLDRDALRRDTALADHFRRLRILYPIYSTDALIELARSLDTRLMEMEPAAPRTRREIARSLIEIYRIVNERRNRPPGDDRPFGERTQREQDEAMSGLEGGGEERDPIGGILEATDPFGNVDAWTAIANGEAPDIPRPPVRRPTRRPPPAPVLPPPAPGPDLTTPTPEVRQRVYQGRRRRIVRRMTPSPARPPVGYGEAGRLKAMTYMSFVNGYVQAWREIIGSGGARGESYYEPPRRAGRARAVAEWQSLLDGPTWELEEFGQHSQEVLQELERNQQNLQRQLETPD